MYILSSILRKTLSGYFFLVLATIILSSCRQEQQQVNVYSGRHYQVDEDLFALFTERTGISVNLVKADADQLISRLRLEAAHSPADLLITADAGRLAMASASGLLQAIDTAIIGNHVPPHLRDPENHWVGLTKRARVFVYHKERVEPDELTDYESLTHEKWKGRILVRSSQSHYNQSLMASMVAALGPERARLWAENLVDGMARSPQGNDRDQVKAIAAGIGDLALVNTYYMGLLLHSSNPEEREVARQMGIFFPNQHGRGTHVNVSGVGLTAHAPNPGNAQKLIAFLLSEVAQRQFAEKNYEYPVIEQLKWPPLLESWGSFKEDPLPLSQLNQHMHEAMFIFNHAGWN